MKGKTPEKREERGTRNIFWYVMVVVAVLERFRKCLLAQVDRRDGRGKYLCCFLLCLFLYL